jgi:mono/diheme cytochrome c family protein
VFRVSQFVRWVIGVVLSLAANPALAQSNLDASKSPAEIFSDTCVACHESARTLKPSNAAFLRKHYTTGPKQAAIMAAFLETAASEPPPAPPIKARRPSDSVEQGSLHPDAAPPTALGAIARQSADTVPSPARAAVDEFEE